MSQPIPAIVICNPNCILIDVQPEVPRAIVIAHGVLASLAWVIFFPLGSILVRVLDGPSTWIVHAVIQLVSMAIFTAAVGTGLQMATRFRLLDNFHVIIGLVIFGLMFTQAVTGFMHHLLFKRYQRRTIASHVHLWLGRALITLGMINGGLGLWVNARSTRSQNVAYGVIAGLIWSTWILISALWEAKQGEPPNMTPRERKILAREKRIQDREARLRFAQKNRMLVETKEWT